MAMHRTLVAMRVTAKPDKAVTTFHPSMPTGMRSAHSLHETNSFDFDALMEVRSDLHAVERAVNVRAASTRGCTVWLAWVGGVVLWRLGSARSVPPQHDLGHGQLSGYWIAGTADYPNSRTMVLRKHRM